MQRGKMLQAEPIQAEQGQSVIELALALPMLLLLVLGVVDLGLGFRSYIALTNAAREGVRWVSIYPDDPAGALARTNAEAERVGLFYGVFGDDDGYTVNFSPVKSSYVAGDEVTVAINYNYDLLFGVIPDLPSVPFQARATMVVLYDPVTP
jgi:hypothetical protein